MEESISRQTLRFFLMLKTWGWDLFKFYIIFHKIISCNNYDANNELIL
jgi:hypothetical protein